MSAPSVIVVNDPFILLKAIDQHLDAAKKGLAERAERNAARDRECAEYNALPWYKKFFKSYLDHPHRFFIYRDFEGEMHMENYIKYRKLKNAVQSGLPLHLAVEDSNLLPNP